ncbi:hypothetical protein GCM10027290_20380 [Micromonospora sonneratiae]|uniref:Recombinase zinc beta ribbon domain-containing protein n=1 Tax=Micromonospora sonneratiae TaxID=1184706 RepID=A0ABW3YGE8_9ACTN
MTTPDGIDRWALHGLVRCGYCEELMQPAQSAGATRTYRCASPCGRSDADAAGLELMAFRTLIAARPDWGATIRRADLSKLAADAYRQIVVHGDLADVRFDPRN